MTIELTKEEAELIIQAHLHAKLKVAVGVEIGCNGLEIYISCAVIEPPDGDL